jgi:hypothetical protein
MQAPASRLGHPPPGGADVQQLGHDRVELIATLLRPRLEVRLADVFGLVGEDLVHALADVPLEVDVLHEHLLSSRRMQRVSRHFASWPW